MKMFVAVIYARRVHIRFTIRSFALIVVYTAKSGFYVIVSVFFWNKLDVVGRYTRRFPRVAAECAHTRSLPKTVGAIQFENDIYTYLHPLMQNLLLLHIYKYKKPLV